MGRSRHDREARDAEILASIDTKTLSIALKACPDGVFENIMNNLSSRVRDMVLDEKELLGPMPFSDVLQARVEIMGAVRALMENGEFSPARASEERGGLTMLEISTIPLRAAGTTRIRTARAPRGVRLVDVGLGELGQAQAGMFVALPRSGAPPTRRRRAPLRAPSRPRPRPSTRPASRRPP